MPSMNKVFLMGHLGRDPEVRFTAVKGTPVANLSMATTKRWTDDGGQKQERTEWHRVVVFGQGAEFVKEYGRKGTPGGRFRRLFVFRDGRERCKIVRAAARGGTKRKRETVLRVAERRKTAHAV